jgi:ribosomal protein S18 acetylase RimI-like enzyme
MDSEDALHIRLSEAEDDAFILGLVPRFVEEFDLPAWRRRSECAKALRADIAHHLNEQPAGSHIFVAENDEGVRVGFLHLMTMKDVFGAGMNAHISDLAVAHEHDGKGVGRALLAYAERWAREHRCAHLQLAVFPGNKRAISVYERHGFGIELLRMIKPLR